MCDWWSGHRRTYHAKVTHHIVNDEQEFGAVLLRVETPDRTKHVEIVLVKTDAVVCNEREVSGVCVGCVCVTTHRPWKCQPRYRDSPQKIDRLPRTNQESNLEVLKVDNDC